MILNPIPTSRALLTWQSPLGSGGPRRRHAIGVLKASDSGADFHYLINDESFLAARSEGFEGYPGLPIREEVYLNALGVFLRRLPSPGRTDYIDFLSTFGLSPSAEWGGLSLLAYTGAKLASDSFSITETLKALIVHSRTYLMSQDSDASELLPLYWNRVIPCS